MDAQNLIEMAETYGSSNYAPVPLVLSRGEGVWLYDADGRRYLDMMSANSATNLGHAHPRMVKAVCDQAGKLSVISRAFYSETLGPLMKKLCDISGLDRVLPMNSGAEAVETAVKIARKWGYVKKGIPLNEARILACTGNFHGRTTALIGFSDTRKAYEFFGPHTPGFDVAQYGDIESARQRITENTCAILVEPIQGEAGVRIPPEGYLRELRALCDEHNLLLILDEIQSAFGRCGMMFSHDGEDIKPDVLTLGKTLGGGMVPISVAMGRKDVMDVLVPGEHGSTFGGNPLACRCALEAIAIIEDENLCENAKRQGAKLMDALRTISNPQIVDVRGRGLLAAVEMGEGEMSAHDYCERLRERGVLAKETRVHSIRLAPPININDDEMDFAIEQLVGALSA
ncbi:MAG: ornithine--oxo-acid transaminase [Deltaproteobacteria bacterium]|nr:ornithine--oxo-acid transaminase [Deltaproteobacteria bacterium]MCB9478646.1 ornithine--oxo-acid transaminase [Deltaproteobacteria bacterium]